MIRALLLLATLAALYFPNPLVANAAEKEPADLKPFLPPLKGWKVSDGPTQYTAENLYDLIDGEAEAYIGYGFVKALAGVLEARSKGGALEWRLYDMGNKLNAFGIYQLYAPPDAKELEFGAAGTRKESYLAFYVSKYFVQIEALGEGEAEMEASLKLAAETAKLLPKDTSPPREILSFPQKGLAQKSIRYMPQGAFGYEFLKPGMEAKYLLEGAEKPTKAFVLSYKKSDEARKSFDAYSSFLAEKAPDSIQQTYIGERALRAQDPYHGPLVLIQAGPIVVGVAGPAGWEAMEKLGRTILKTAIQRGGKPPTPEPQEKQKEH